MLTGKEEANIKMAIGHSSLLTGSGERSVVALRENAVKDKPVQTSMPRWLFCSCLSQIFVRVQVTQIKEVLKAGVFRPRQLSFRAKCILPPLPPLRVKSCLLIHSNFIVVIICSFMKAFAFL